MRRGLWLGLLASAGGALAVSALPEMTGRAEAPDVEAAAVRSLAAPAGPGAPAGPSAPAAALSATADAPSATAATQTTRFTGPWPPLSREAQAAWAGTPAPAATTPPAAATPASAPAAAPSAPPFPYTWLGQIEQDGQLRFFLANPTRTLVVAEGEAIEGGWRVGGLRDGHLQATWLATEETVSLAAK